VTDELDALVRWFQQRASSHSFIADWFDSLLNRN
jgi:hypothetical protein